jgi:putative membrane protein
MDEKQDRGQNSAVDDPRVYFAAERTLLAWIRTGLAMMGFGFVVARFGLFLHETAIAQHTPPVRTSGLSLWIGTTLVILGVLVNALAAMQYMRDIARFQRGESYRPNRLSLGVIVSLILSIIGIGMAIYLFATSR